jgi:hypothetical protein
MQARAVPDQSLALLVLNGKLVKLKLDKDKDPMLYWDDVGSLKRLYEISG